jgi:hypothetical protein
MRKEPALVRFIGNERDYIRSDAGLPSFIAGHTYKAYLLDIWEGEWENLNVEDETGRVTNFNLLSDFEVIEDYGDILSARPAKVRCIESTTTGIFGVRAGKVYDCIGYSWQPGFVYYVADESYDTLPYSPELFEVVDDPDDILDELEGTEVFWWDSPVMGELVYKNEIRFSFDPEATGAAYFKILKEGRDPKAIEYTSVIESLPGLVLADYSVLGEVPEGIEVLSFDSCFKERIQEKDGSYWLTIGSIPLISLELPDEAAAIAQGFSTGSASIGQG